MIARELNPMEWDRLQREQWSDLLAAVRPEDVRVVVVEDGGEIVASLMVMRMTHLEGLWIKPSRKRSAGVVRSLLREAGRAARPWTNGFVFAGASTDKMRGILSRLKGQRLDMDSFAMRLP